MKERRRGRKLLRTGLPIRVKMFYRCDDHGNGDDQHGTSRRLVRADMMGWKALLCLALVSCVRKIPLHAISSCFTPISSNM